MRTIEVQFSIEEAEAELDMILARVEAGETVIVTRDGKPIAYLRPAVYPDRGFGVPDDSTPEA